MGLVSALKDGLEGQQTLKAPLAFALQVTKTFFRHVAYFQVFYVCKGLLFPSAKHRQTA